MKNKGNSNGQAVETTDTIPQPNDLVLVDLQNELHKSQQAAADNLEKASQLETLVGDLQGKLSQAESDLEAKETAITGLKSELETVLAENEAKDEVIAKLNEKTATSEVASKEKITFIYDEKVYEVLGPVRIPGPDHPEPYTALEIASDERLQAILIAKQSGMIREIK